MWIMIAGPYRSGANSQADREHNLTNLNRAAYELFRKGHVPVVGVNCALPLIAAAGSDAYESIMMPLSLAMADRCDAVLRIGGFSAGADEEVELIRSRGGIAYYSLAEVPDAIKDPLEPVSLDSPQN